MQEQVQGLDLMQGVPSIPAPAARAVWLRHPRTSLSKLRLRLAPGDGCG
jgi:hypothetical protein